jgi:hypothetical protein
MGISRPLTSAFPEVRELKRDPAGTLSCGAIAIVDRPMIQVLGLVAVTGFLFLMPDHIVKVVVMRYLMLGLLLIAPFYIVLWKRRVIFHSDGMEYAFGRRSVCIPWAAFNCSKPSSFKHDAMKLHLDRSAIDTVEHRRDGIAVDNGIGPSSYFMEIEPNGAFALRMPIGAERGELGELILHVARSFQSIRKSPTRLVELRSP